MNHFIILIGVVAIMAPSSYSKNCELYEDHGECRSEELCRNSIADISDIENFNIDSEDSKCYDDLKNHINYKNVRYYPILLKFNALDTNQVIPYPINIKTKPVINLVYSFDVSDNGFIISPVIEEMPNLKYLDLSKNNITSAVLSNRHELKSIQRIDYSYNRITNVIVNSSDHQYVTLREINLSHNRIVTIPFEILNGLHNVDFLDLSFNYVDSLNQSFTSNSLKTLILSNNRLKTIPSVAFNSISSLHLIDLSHNTIKTIDDSIFDNQKSLKTLNLSYNPELRIPKNLFQKVKSLDTLSLSGIGIDFADFEGLTVTNLNIFKTKIINIGALNLNKIKFNSKLVLSDNIFSRLELGSFDKLFSLIDLGLSNNQIDYIQPNVFRDTSNIKYLNLSYNAISKIGYGDFFGLGQLETLDLSHNVLKSLEIERLYPLKKLKELILDYNLISTIDLDSYEKHPALQSISIGNNFFSCKTLVYWLQISKLRITTLTNSYGQENVNGISCDKKLPSSFGTTKATVEPQIILNNKNDELRTTMAKEQYAQQNRPEIKNGVITFIAIGVAIIIVFILGVVLWAIYKYKSTFQNLCRSK